MFIHFCNLLEFIKKLDSFREKGNSNAHSIEVFVKKNIDDNREEINLILMALKFLKINSIN